MLTILIIKSNRTADRILNQLVLEKSVLSSVWSVHRVIPSQMGRQAFQW